MVQVHFVYQTTLHLIPFSSDYFFYKNTDRRTAGNEEFLNICLFNIFTSF